MAKDIIGITILIFIIAIATAVNEIKKQKLCENAGVKCYYNIILNGNEKIISNDKQ